MAFFYTFPVAQRVPVAVGTAAIDRIVVPRTSTLHSEVPVPSPLSRLYEKNGYFFNFSEKRLFVNPRNPVFPKNRVSEKNFDPPAAEKGKRKRAKG